MEISSTHPISTNYLYPLSTLKNYLSKYLTPLILKVNIIWQKFLEYLFGNNEPKEKNIKKLKPIAPEETHRTSEIVSESSKPLTSLPEPISAIQNAPQEDPLPVSLEPLGNDPTPVAVIPEEDPSSIAPTSSILVPNTQPIQPEIKHNRAVELTPDSPVDIANMPIGLHHICRDFFDENGKPIVFYKEVDGTLQFTICAPTTPSQRECFATNYPIVCSLFEKILSHLPKESQFPKGVKVDDAVGFLAKREFVDLAFHILFALMHEKVKKNFELSCELANQLRLNAWHDEKQIAHLEKMFKSLSSKFHKELTALLALARLSEYDIILEPVNSKIKPDYRLIPYYQGIFNLLGSHVFFFCVGIRRKAEGFAKNAKEYQAKMVAKLPKIDPTKFDRNAISDLIGHVREIGGIMQTLQKVADVTAKMNKMMPRSCSEPLQQFAQISEVSLAFRRLMRMVNNATMQYDRKIQGMIIQLSYILGIELPSECNDVALTQYRSLLKSKAVCLHDTGRVISEFIKQGLKPVSSRQYSTKLIQDIFTFLKVQFEFKWRNRKEQEGPLNQICQHLDEQGIIHDIRLHIWEAFHQSYKLHFENVKKYLKTLDYPPHPAYLAYFEINENIVMSRILSVNLLEESPTLISFEEFGNKLAETFFLISKKLENEFGHIGSCQNYFNTLIQIIQKINSKQGIPKVNTSTGIDYYIQMINVTRLLRNLAAFTLPVVGVFEHLAYSSISDWRHTVDLDLDDPIFDNDANDTVPTPTPTPKKTKKKARKPAPATSEPAISVKAPIATEEPVLKGSSLSKIYQWLVIKQGLSFLSPKMILMKKHDRLTAMLYDQCYSAFVFVRTAEILQHMPCMSNGEASKTANALLMFGAFQAAQSCERGITARLRAKNPNLIYEHNLTTLYNRAGITPKNNILLSNHSRDMITYRYPKEKSIIQNALLKKFPELVADFAALSLEPLALPEKILQDLLKEVSSFNLETDVPSLKLGQSQIAAASLFSATQLQKMNEATSQLGQCMESVEKELARVQHGQIEHELLVHIYRHLFILSEIPSILALHANRKSLLIPGMMMLISGQYAVENIGLLCGSRNNPHIIAEMGWDLHCLKIYCDEFNISDKLDKVHKEVIKKLDVKKRFQTICESGKLSSEYMDLLYELFDWSLAASDESADGGDFNPAKRTEADFDALQRRLVNDYLDIASMVVALVEIHVKNSYDGR